MEKNNKVVHEVMYTEYAYIKLRYLRWAVTSNGQSLDYVTGIQNGRLEHVPDCNLFIHFAESWNLSFTEMHGEKVGGVNCFVQQTHTNIVLTLLTHFW